MTIMSERMRRLMDEEVKRQRLEEEMAIGRQIQLSLLPENTPQIPGWEFATAYQSARQVGGDLYDFIPVPDAPGCLNVVIADVTDKGVAAALFMAFSRTVLRVESANGRSPAETLKHINRFILHDVRAKLFLSAFYATLNTRNGSLIYANAGHEKPLWLHASSGQIEPLPASGLLLGVFGNVTWEQCEIELAQDDCLIMYTDGITEARNSLGEMYGEERLAALATAVFPATAPQLLEAITNDLKKFSGNTSLEDDFTLVVVKRQA
jgi:sigma-B regulation protein RsbU (phosphoserine phosphatase)